MLNPSFLNCQSCSTFHLKWLFYFFLYKALVRLLLEYYIQARVHLEGLNQKVQIQMRMTWVIPVCPIRFNYLKMTEKWVGAITINYS